MSEVTTRIDDAITDHLSSSGDIVTGWLLIASTTTVDSVGDDVSGIVTLAANDSQPWATHLGLIEAARVRLKHDFIAGMEEK